MLARPPIQRQLTIDVAEEGEQAEVGGGREEPWTDLSATTI